MKNLLSKKNYIITAVAIVCVLGIAAIFFMGGNKEFKEHISLGNKYLQEMKYEEAIIEFTAAFNLEPKNKDAAEGIENACLAYADSMLADAENVEIETFVKVSEILMSSYETTQIETIQSKVEEIEQIIEEKEEALEEARLAEEKAKKEAEEKAKKEAEEEAKRLEEEKKKEEERKQKVLAFYKKKVEQIAIQDFYMEVTEIVCEETDNEWIITLTGLVCMWSEKLVFNVNKETENAVITEYWEVDISSGEWRLLSADMGYSVIGQEYDFTYTENE